MLRELHISGLGVLEDLDLSFAPGLNVLTGETGAGKTMIAAGLALALGRRASATRVRPGAAAARVQALFDGTPEAESAGWAEDGELLLSRSVGADGKGAARIGGELAPVSALAALAVGLVEIHGQHEGALLRSAAAQTRFLDRFAGAEHGATLAAFADVHERLTSAERCLADLDARERERRRAIDVLAHQVRELETAAVRPGELAELEAEESRLAHAERLLERAAEAERALSADDAAADGVRLASAALGEVGAIDPAAGELAGRADSLAEEVQELAHDVRAYREILDVDPARLEQVRERIAAIGGLLRKYGDDEAEVLAFLERCRAELRELEGSDEERVRLDEEARALRGEADGLVARISAVRSEAAPRLSGAIEAELLALGMDGATVRIELVPQAQPTATGAERVEFGFSGGSGQPLLPLSKFASGGELSRTMLACRSVLVDLDDVPTLVFDEIDAGIGGRAAVAVGRRLARLARDRQILVVTHLPQIAAFADRHLVVEKYQGTASVRAVEGGERVAELSRMLSGLPDSDAAAVHAEELLAEADRAKAPA